MNLRKIKNFFNKQFYVLFFFLLNMILIVFLCSEIRETKVKILNMQERLYELESRVSSLEEQYSNWSMMTEENK